MAEVSSDSTLVVRVTSRHAPDVYRVIELHARQKLRDLHAAIAEAFELEGRSGWRIYLSNRAFDRASERGQDATTQGATLRASGSAPGAQWLHVDLEGSGTWHRVEIVRTGAAEPGVRYPRVIERGGELPDPFEKLDSLFGGFGGVGDERDGEPLVDAPDDAEARALADAMASAVAEYDAHFERDDAAEAPRPRATVDRDLALVRRLAARFADNPAEFDALVEAREIELEDWLAMLPFDLEDHGLIDEAIAMCDTLVPLLGAIDLAETRALILARAGRRDETAAAAERAIDQVPEDIELRVGLANALHLAGHDARAEELCRSVLDADLEGEDASFYANAIELLGEILRASGRAAEAQALERSEKAVRAREAALASDGEDLLEGLESALSAVRTQAPRSKP